MSSSTGNRTDSEAPELSSSGFSSYLRAVAKSFSAKAVVLVLGGAATLVSARSIVDTLGITGYALVALVSTLPALLAVSELGVGAAVIDAFSGRDREHMLRTLTAGGRTLLSAGAVIAVCGLLTAVSGAADALLASASGPGAAPCVAVVSVLFGCSLPLSLGGSVLGGLGRYHFAVLLQGAGTLIALTVVLLGAATDAPPVVFAASVLIGQCAAGVGSLLLAGRMLGMRLLRVVLFPLRRFPRTRIIQLAGPMAVIKVTSAVAYGADRLVLSSVTNSVAVAVYSAGAQLYAPASALVAAAAMPLWRTFSRHRRISPEAPRRHLLRLTACFTTGGVVISALLVTVGPAVASWMLHGRADVGPGLMAAFSALVLTHAVNYPVAMWLSDPEGLRFQALRAVVMAVVNLAASIPMAHLLGPTGPVLASAGAHFLCVTVPCHRRVFTRHGAMTA
ncbi:lipopolysaccharide biosynthesis protein [Streptomyces sp. NPDC005931]|uniref:lipopolysaccharide biosynthesis protein n=1 Tax=Streptomyces sp. NPDC005931 TaxID=3364737 RepID=UPI0036A03FB1